MCLQQTQQRRFTAPTRRWRVALAAVLVLASTASSVSAQNYSFDARRIGLGGAGGTPNVASKLVEQERRYKSVLIPVGLVKVLSDVHVFYPNREDFDFSRAVEYSSSPFHFAFGRQKDITVGSFFRDMIHAQLNSDLNTYREPRDPNDSPMVTTADGLLDVTWGKEFKLREDEHSFQRIYVGAGPYYGSRAYANFDADLERVLSSSTNRYIPSATMRIGGGETSQLALDITGGYRARFPIFGADGPGARRDGMYIAANYHHLQGLRLDRFQANLQLETDTNGLLVPDPPTTPFTLGWDATSGHGVGLSLDFGVSFVINRWDFGAGVTGLANRINWHDTLRRELSLVNLRNGVDFVYGKLPRTNDTLHLEMPTTYTADFAYHRDTWSNYTEYSNGLGGVNFRSGVEYRGLKWIELRGAGRYSQGSWYPAAGVGVDLTRSFGVDAGFYGTKTFLETEPHVGMALSFRWDKR
jgi:hypothetical protein